MVRSDRPSRWALRVMRAATCRTRWRKVVISKQVNSRVWLNPVGCAQAIKSAAASMIASRAAWYSRSWEGLFGQAIGFGLAVAVLDGGELAVTQFRAGQLPRTYPGCGVGDERGHPHPLGAGGPQLRSGGVAILFSPGSAGLRWVRCQGRPGRWPRTPTPRHESRRRPGSPGISHLPEGVSTAPWMRASTGSRIQRPLKRPCCTGPLTWFGTSWRRQCSPAQARSCQEHGRR